jgi:hypothetical protein
MQNILRGIVLVCSLLILGSLAACEEGSYFNSSTEQIKSDYVSRLEAVGTDLRIYEFTPRSAPHIQCVFVAGQENGGLQCWGKGVINPDFSGVRGLTNTPPE